VLRFQYNSKELEKDFGINLSDYGARWYDASVGRFTGVDPIAAQFAWVNPYNYAENEPVMHIDLWGLQKYYKPNGEFSHQVGDDNSYMILSSNFWATDTDVAAAVPAYTMDQEVSRMEIWGDENYGHFEEYAMSTFSRTLYDEKGRYEATVFVEGTTVTQGFKNKVDVGSSINSIDPSNLFGWRRVASIHNHPNSGFFSDDRKMPRRWSAGGDIGVALELDLRMYIVHQNRHAGRIFNPRRYNDSFVRDSIFRARNGARFGLSEGELLEGVSEWFWEWRRNR